MTDENLDMCREGAEYAERESVAARFLALREERNRRLWLTDRFMISDYAPILDDTFLSELREYRQKLRNITTLPGAPWTPGTVPWPVRPEPRKKEL